MFIKNVIFFIIVCLTIGCAQERASLDLKQYDVISEVFDADEIVQLKGIILFVDSLILSKESTIDVNMAYHNYFEYIASSTNHEMLNRRYALDSMCIVEFVGSLKGKSVFDEIWKIEKGLSIDRKNVISESLVFNLKGKYLKFLKLFANGNPSIKYYYESNKTIGGFCPHASAIFISEHQQYDFNNVVLRLIASVHIISVKYDKKL